MYAVYGYGRSRRFSHIGTIEGRARIGCVTGRNGGACR